jgi:hypothetical protein
VDTHEGERRDGSSDGADLAFERPGAHQHHSDWLAPLREPTGHLHRAERVLLRNEVADPGGQRFVLAHPELDPDRVTLLRRERGRCPAAVSDHHDPVLGDSEIVDQLSAE